MSAPLDKAPAATLSEADLQQTLRLIEQLPDGPEKDDLLERFHRIMQSLAERRMTRTEDQMPMTAKQKDEAELRELSDILLAQPDTPEKVELLRRLVACWERVGLQKRAEREAWAKARDSWVTKAAPSAPSSKRSIDPERQEPVVEYNPPSNPVKTWAEGYSVNKSFSERLESMAAEWGLPGEKDIREPYERVLHAPAGEAGYGPAARERLRRVLEGESIRDDRANPPDLSAVRHGKRKKTDGQE